MNGLGNSFSLKADGGERPPQVLFFVPSECGLLRLAPSHQALVTEVARHQRERARQETARRGDRH